MFFICELKKLRQLKTSLLARFRCEKKLAYLPTQLEPRIEASEELAALKVAEENLEEQRRIDAKNRKKRLRRATWIAFFLSLIASGIAVLLLSLTLIPALLVVVGATALVTLIVHLIAKSAIKKGPAKNADAIAACEEELAFATVAFEAAKVIIEDGLQEEIAYHENVLKALNAIIEMNTVVHDCDKNYNTVCQIIWCFEHKYAYTVKDAKQWIARANHSKYVRAKLDQLNLEPQDEADVDLDATEGKDYSEEIPETTEAEA